MIRLDYYLAVIDKWLNATLAYSVLSKVKYYRCIYITPGHQKAPIMVPGTLEFYEGKQVALGLCLGQMFPNCDPWLPRELQKPVRGAAESNENPTTLYNV